MNLVERFFREISENCIRYGGFSSIRELADAILSYLAGHNQNPTRYVWKDEEQEILYKIARARTMLR